MLAAQLLAQRATLSCTKKKQRQYKIQAYLYSAFVFFDFGRFWSIFGPRLSKIAKSTVRTLGQAPKALRQPASWEVEIFFPRFCPKIQPKLDRGRPNFEFWTNFENFIFSVPECTCRTPPHLRCTVSKILKLKIL